MNDLKKRNSGVTSIDDEEIIFYAVFNEEKNYEIYYFVIKGDKRIGFADFEDTNWDEGEYYLYPYWAVVGIELPLIYSISPIEDVNGLKEVVDSFFKIW